MRATVKLMSMDLMDRLFAHPGPRPDELAMQTENTHENRQAEAEAALKDARLEKIRRILDREFALLEPRYRTPLAVYLIEHEGWPRDLTADRLEVKRGTVRVAILRSRRKEKSRDWRSRGEVDLRYVYGPGKDAWDAIVIKALELRDEEEKHQL